MRYKYFSIGFVTAILVSILIISCSEPLEASYCEPGSSEWCPLYVKVID